MNTVVNCHYKKVVYIACTLINHLPVRLLVHNVLTHLIHGQLLNKGRNPCILFADLGW